MVTGETRREHLRPAAALFALAYLGVAVATTWPLVRHLTSHVPGHTLDAYVHYWNGWWVGEALKRAQTPFFTHNLFYPRGVSLVFHNFAWVHIVEWLALRTVLGGITAYNLVFIVNLALGGWAAFLLVRYLTGDARVAFLAGLIYQCWPYRMSQLDHPNLISTYAIPLFLLFLLRTLREGRWWTGLLSGIFFALIGYTRWQLLIPASVIGAVVALFILPEVWASRHQWGRPLLLGSAVAALGLTPPALLFGSEWRTTSTDLVREVDEAALQTDVMAYLTPSPDHPVFGSVTAAAYDRYYPDRSGGRRFPAYLGLTTMALAAIGLFRAPRRSLPWLVAAAVMVMLALGLELRVNGQVHPALPTPYRLFRKTFIIRLVRFPDRFSLFTALPVAVLSAQGAQHLLDVLRRQVGTPPLVALSGLVLLVSFEFLGIPVSLQNPSASPIHTTLANVPGNFGLLNLPIDAQACKRYMFEQTIHRRPILQGHVSRLPEGAYGYLDGHALLRRLRQFGEMDPRFTDVGRQLGALAGDDVRYLVVQKRDIEADRLARWRRYLMIAPRFEDEQIAVFSTAPVAGQDFELITELAPGVGPVRVEMPLVCANPGGLLAINVGWGAIAPPDATLEAELSLLSADGIVAQMEKSEVSPGWPTDDWPAHTLVWGYYTVRLDPALAPGSHRIRLALVDRETGEETGPPLTIGSVKVQESACSDSMPPESTVVNAVFDDALRLLGYRTRRNDDRLLVKLYWRSERRMDVDYKVFVHVFDRGSGRPVAQDDAMPQAWRYPTSLWYPGEQVEDEMSIDLHDVVPGVYGVAVGVYDPETMERLAVTETGTGSARNGGLILPGGIVRIGEDRG